MTTETWIVYKTEGMSEHGWEERILMPRQSLTDILEENWSAEENPTIPEIGDRTRAYKTDDQDAITHAREGDWIVTRVEKFASFDTDTRIVICYCKYAPIAPQWEEVSRGAPANELLLPVAR
ncbi:hypothetical protein [Okeania sp.]|uniref:hypothetical protein n=1 Tax=Okeania sp. TaxID=3100323 RepID=UPI002B4B2E9F|nr:hypothetical protein [Okeania sp.]MEB3342589.1 hypothetical protein [Okeania sp.]